VAIRTDQRVRISDTFVIEHHARQIFNVYLMHDTRRGWYHAEVVERLLRPAQQHVSLAIALVFRLRIASQRVGRAEVVHLHGVVDHEFRGKQRIDAFGIATHRRHGVTHGGKVHDGRDTREILQHDAGRVKSDLRVGLRLRIPIGNRDNVRRSHRLAVLIAQQVLQQDA
jgi:hypothetical protein